jgi:hypothetical protein
MSEFDDSSDGDHSSGQSLEPMLLAVVASLEKTRMQAEVNRIAEVEAEREAEAEALSSSTATAQLSLDDRSVSEDHKSDSSSDEEEEMSNHDPEDEELMGEMSPQISTPTENHSII